MTDFNNIEDSFRDAFQNWEANHSASEMHQAWQNVSSHIPAAPAHSPLQSIPKAGFTAGKIVGFSAAAGIIITTATLLYYNIRTTISPESERKVNKTEMVGSNSPTITKDIETRVSEQGLKELNSGMSKSEPMVFSTSKDKSATIWNSNSKINQEDIRPSSTHSSENVNTSQSNKAVNNVNSFSQQNTELSDTSICLTSAYKIYNQKALDIEWGDGQRSLANSSVEHYYALAGTYRIRIQGDGNTISRQVLVKNAPSAHFSNFESNGLNCKFKNLSENAIKFNWDFGDNSESSNSETPEHLYQDSGRYKVILTAFNSAGCKDIRVLEIHVSDKSQFSIPNVFTPNGDGRNDEFEITMQGEILFELSIYDEKNMRLVFNTNTKSRKWNGSDYKSGLPCSTGNYLYHLQYQYQGEEIKELSGMIRLNR